MNTKKTAEDRAAEKYPNSIKYGLFDSVSNIQFRKVYATCIREEVEPREAEVERLRALVQRLMDRSSDVIARWDSPKWKWDQHTGELITELRREVDAAKQQGFVPTNTTEA